MLCSETAGQQASSWAQVQRHIRSCQQHGLSRQLLARHPLARHSLETTHSALLSVRRGLNLRTQPRLTVASVSAASSVSPARAQEQAIDVTMYNFVTSQRHQVQTSVERLKDSYVAKVEVTVPTASKGKDLYISWGAYRASAAKWFHPAPPKISVPGSEQDPHSSKAQRIKLKSANKGATYSTQFKVQLQLAPVTLGFRIFIPGEGSNGASAGQYMSPAGARHFSMPVGLQPGWPLPQGPAAAAVSEDGTTCDLNFAVRSRHAASMALCLVRQPTDVQPNGGYIEIALDPLVHKTGDMWHVCLEGVKDVASLCYGWRAEADVAWEGKSRFHPGQVMMDPYCPLIQEATVPDDMNLVAPRGGMAGSMPINTPHLTLSSLSFLLDDFSFQGVQQPRHSLQESVLLELDISSVSQGSQAQQAGVPPQHQGKFLGLLHHAQLIRQLGATAVVLTAVMARADGVGPTGQAHLSFFAPDPNLAAGETPLAPSQELKQAIKELHAQGIEVILQVEFCLTSEGTDKRPQASSLRGLDAATYYRHNGVLNCGHAVVRQLVLDSLHHWAEEYQVDGFCFVNAETLVQDTEGNILDNPPLAEDIAQDPVLQGLKLIAWPADDSLLPRGGERGFPHWGVWAERNKTFQKDMLAWLVQNQNGMASNVATRMAGSADLLADRTPEGLLPGSLATARGPAYGVNSVTTASHTLADVVASTHWNEGEHGQQGTLAKSLLAASLLCQGTPLLPEEALQDPGLAAFVGTVIRFRQANLALLHPPHFASNRELLWHGATIGSQPDWDGEAANHDYHAANFIAYSLHHPHSPSIYIGYNPYNYPIQIDIPGPPAGHIWRQAIDTAEPAPLDAVHGAKAYPSLHEWNHYHIQAKAVIALLSEAVQY